MFGDLALTEMSALVERIRGLNDGDEAAALFVELEQVRRRIDAAMAEVVAMADQRGWCDENGCASPASWIRTITNLSVSEAKRIGRVAQLVRDHPMVGEHLGAGTIGIGQATRLAGLHANHRVADMLDEFLPTLVQYAEALPFEDFNTVAIRWEQLADADGAHRDHGEVHDARDAGVHSVGVATYVDARFGNLQGALIAEVFEKYLQAELADDLARFEAGGSTSGLERTTKQRRADALYAVFASAADRFLPAPEPLVNILIDQATYEQTLEAMESGVRPSTLVHPGENLLDKRSETTGGIALDPVEVVAVSLVGQVRRVVMNQAGVPIDLGRRSRIFAGGSRSAAMLKRRRCIWPGCNVMSCEVDHRVPWADGGPTDVANSDPLCRRHNRLKATGFTTHYEPELRRSIVKRSDGRRLVPV